MKRLSLFSLVCGLALIGSAGCRSAQTYTSSLDDEVPSTQFTAETENFAQPEETFQISHNPDSYRTNDTNASPATSIGRLPIAASARNPRLCTSG